ncbi:aa3-type cytochrome c oxidase subunit IV [Roseovarius sp. S1116L3]
MADHEHGEMDIKDHEKTFDAFVKWATRVAIFAVCVLLFMALVNS